MRRHREVAAIVALALAALAAAGEPFEAFARRLGLRDTLRTWNIDRLRHGAVAVRREAARALSADGALLSAGALETSERREVLRLVIAALAPDDVAGVRARLELARQSLAEAAGQVDALRGDGGASAASAPVRQSLAQAAELVAPIVEQQPGAIRRGDPLEGLREPAWLLEAWRLVLEGWLERRERQSPRGSIARATALLAGLLDTPPESPLPDQARPSAASAPSSVRSRSTLA